MQLGHGLLCPGVRGEARVHGSKGCVPVDVCSDRAPVAAIFAAGPRDVVHTSVAAGRLKPGVANEPPVRVGGISRQVQDPLVPCGVAVGHCAAAPLCVALRREGRHVRPSGPSVLCLRVLQPPCLCPSMDLDLADVPPTLDRMREERLVAMERTSGAGGGGNVCSVVSRLFGLIPRDALERAAKVVGAAVLTAVLTRRAPTGMLAALAAFYYTRARRHVSGSSPG
mmetsp:Transcript_137251/g.426523  ORF Transcript_137251/g.426523 Transcript_137251/m.426523 type:complete len:225 (-) Transcript_137251:22-696(-)